MKKGIVLVILLFMSSVVFSQSINQFDENGSRHGIWKKNFENTNILRYEGEFFHGKEIGLFNFYMNIKKKAVLTAAKQFNKIDSKAYVKFFTSTGKVISEGLMDGKIHLGDWKYYQKNSDKLLILEHYDDFGNINGTRFVYYANGEIAEKQEYKVGQLHGVSVWYSEKNVVLKYFVYDNGVLHGVSKFYSPKGELMAEGMYKQGKKHGIWKYYESGKLTKEKDFTVIGKYKKKS
jgi:antitoxin component YwqK of YwqJK toxin-antitoxin module